MQKLIDLASDTATRPTQGMREAIAQALVGDEQRGEDPSTLKLESRMAELLGFEAGTFLISATQANAIALMLHCGPGDEVLAAENSHIVADETGGAAVLARASLRTIPTSNGIFDKEAVRSRVRGASPRSPRSRLVCIENTTNMGGGRPWPLSEQRGVIDLAKDMCLSVHLDGTRLFHASTALKVAPADVAQGFDTVTVCLSKGLGCPAGALLLSSKADVDKIVRFKHVLGGAMRQSGMLAAAGLYALEHNLPRLEQDHELAAHLASRLGEIPTLIVEALPVRTNMVFFDWPDAASLQLEDRLTPHGVRVARVGPQRFRAVTHLDVTRADVDQAVNALREVTQGINRCSVQSASLRE